MSDSMRTSVPAQSQMSLKLRAFWATVWVSFGSVGGFIIRLLSNLILTRLLFPEAFGLMLVTSTVLFMMHMLSDLGINQSIIRGEHGDDPLFLDTAWSFQIMRGVLLWLGACVFASLLFVTTLWGWIPSHLTWADSRLPWLIVAASFGMVITGFQSTDLATATRRLIVRPVVIMETVVQLVGVVLTGLLAWWLRSVWALVISGLVVNIFQLLASHVVLRIHRNRWRIERKFLVELFTFGKWLAVSSAITIFVVGGPGIIMASLLEPQVLGLFSIAFTLMTSVAGLMSTLLGRVFLPAISEVIRNGRSQLAQKINRLRWRIDPVLMVVSGGICALGPFVIQILYDKRYAEAGQILQFIAVGIVFERYSIFQSIYLALNEPKNQVILNLVRAISLFVTVPVAFNFFGLQGALIAIGLREIISLPLIFWFNAKHDLNNFRLELVAPLFWPIGWCLGELFLIMYSWIIKTI
jgi:O-antigen/teichoic acid export membrane protein